MVTMQSDSSDSDYDFDVVCARSLLAITVDMMEDAKVGPAGPPPPPPPPPSLLCSGVIHSRRKNGEAAPTSMFIATLKPLQWTASSRF